LKIYYVLVALALVMAFITGQSVFYLQGRFNATEEDIQAISSLKLDFQARVPPQAIINISAHYPNRHFFKLLSPVYTVPLPQFETRATFLGNKDCFKNIKNLYGTFSFEKIFLWEQFRCGKIKKLPDSFFEKPPYMHPSGMSFAYMSYLRGGDYFHSLYWLLGNLRLFHVTELREIQELSGQLSGAYEVLSRLSEDNLRSISKGQGTILNRDYLLARIIYPDGPGLLEFRVYGRRDLNAFLKNSNYTLAVFQEGQSCLYQDGQLCWNQNSKKIFEFLNLSHVAYFSGSLLMTSLVAGALFGALKKARAEEERKKLALQILTHEIRTPVASMLLQLEQLGGGFDQLDNDKQEAFLRLSGDVYRLKKLAETSKSYLRLSHSKESLGLKMSQVTSLNEFIANVLDDFPVNSINFIKPASDRGLITDPYWLAICLKNLLENALSHGVPPIILKFEENLSKINIIVQDSGSLEFQDLAKLTSEYVKGSSSKGTGLGLSIVKKVIAEMGGELRLKTHPTQFIISLSSKNSIKAKFDNAEEVKCSNRST